MKIEDGRFPDVETIVALHDRVLAKHGGQSGVRLAELGAVLCFALAKNHAFLDGNKRIAITAAAAFLGANGHPLTLEPDRWEAIIVGVAAGNTTRDELTAHLAAEMGGDVTIA